MTVPTIGDAMTLKRRKPAPPAGNLADTWQAMADGFANKLTSGVAAHTTNGQEIQAAAALSAGPEGLSCRNPRVTGANNAGGDV
jgi:hypothetical protein